MSKSTEVRAIDMSARQFKGLLAQIHNTGRKLDQLIARGIAYCVHQHVTHGNKNAWGSLREAVPVFARKIVDDARKAAASCDRADEEAIAEVQQSAETALEERRQKSAKRKPKADKAEEETAQDTAQEENKRQEGQGPAVKNLGGTLQHAGGEPISLTEEEYRAALKAVEAIRKGKQVPKAA